MKVEMTTVRFWVHPTTLERWEVDLANNLKEIKTFVVGQIISTSQPEVKRLAGSLSSDRSAASSVVVKGARVSEIMKRANGLTGPITLNVVIDKNDPWHADKQAWIVAEILGDNTSLQEVDKIKKAIWEEMASMIDSASEVSDEELLGIQQAILDSKVLLGSVEGDCLKNEAEEEMVAGKASIAGKVLLDLLREVKDEYKRRVNDITKRELKVEVVVEEDDEPADQITAIASPNGESKAKGRQGPKASKAKIK